MQTDALSPRKLCRRAAVVVALLVAWPSAGDSGCRGPTQEIAVSLAQQIVEERLVHFTVENRGRTALTFFAVGEGSALEMLIMEENLPREILAPAGWRGFVGYEDEGLHMRIVWEAKQAEASIAPGARLAGFGLRLPKIVAREKPSVGIDGRPEEAVDFTRAPFTARLLLSECVWGRVEPAAERTAPGDLHAGFYGGRARNEAIRALPAATVSLEVSQQAGTDRVVTFTVDNRSGSEIEMLAVGDREVPEMQLLTENIPKEILAPPGWSGLLSFEPDLMYMRVVWRALDPARRIRPGVKLAGFGLRLPPMPSWQQPPFYWPDKRPAEALEMTRTPFTVQLTGAGVAWGRAEPAPPATKAEKCH